MVPGGQTPSTASPLGIAPEHPEPRPLRHAVGRDRHAQGGVDRRAQGQVAGSHVLDLLAAEALLELADAAGGEAPHVVDGEALAREVGDGGPLQQVVRAGLGARIGHAAVGLDRPFAAGEVEERGDPLAVLRAKLSRTRPVGANVDQTRS